MSSYKLYTDSEVFNKEYDSSFKLSDIMASEGIDGRARIVSEEYDTKEYRVDGSGFTFSITTVY